jgi:lysophospholipase L1-like esterase
MSERAESLYVRVVKGALIALILATVIGSVALELHLRASIRPPPNPQQHVYLYKPLTRVRVQISEDVPGLPKRETLFTTNALGVRGDELDLADKSVFKIMTLGGSVTECMALDDEDAWPRRLQTELQAGSDQRIWVGNAGRSGAMTLDYIAHAQILLPVFEPDVVIVMPGGNDLQAIAEGRYFPLDLEQPTVLARYAAALYTDYPIDLLEPLYIYAAYERLVSTQVQDLAPLYQKMKRARFAAKKLPAFEDFDEALDIYRSNLRSLYTTLRRLHGPPQIILMTHPFLWAEGMGKAEEQALWAGYTCMDCPNRRFYAHEALAAGLRSINRETLALCENMNLKCFDLEPRVPKTLENFYDDGHLKEAGARLVARLLGEFMLHEGLRGAVERAVVATDRLAPAQGSLRRAGDQ